MPIDIARPHGQTAPLIFTLHISPRTVNAQYPLHVSLQCPSEAAHQEVLAETKVLLQLPERLVRRAAALLLPLSQLHGGDEDVMGTFLARQLLVAPVRQILLQSVAGARERDTSLAIALRIDAPELTTLPWEWLTVAGRNPWAPALLEDYGLVRFVGPRTRSARHGRSSWSLFGRDTRPSLLLVAPSENDAVLLAIKRALRPLIAGRKVRYDELIAPTTRELARAVTKQRPDVLHILARAEFDQADTPQLFLGEPLGVDEIAALLGDTRPLILLDGSWRPTGALAAASNRLAHGLVERLLDGVVAFHSPLSPDESATFAHGLYGALADELPLYEAVIAGRQALAAANERAPWGLPILVQREGSLA